MEKALSLDCANLAAGMLSAAQTSPEPLLVHMLGIPGSGKTTFLTMLQQYWPLFSAVDPVYLGFDQIMQALPSYQIAPDKVQAFKEFEIPARETGYRILEKLLQKRCSILFDNGGSAGHHPELLRAARDQYGYRIVLVALTTPLPAARARVDQRSVDTGQHTPLYYLEERAQKLDALMGTYCSLTPHFYTFENGGGDVRAFQEKSIEVIRGMAQDLRSLKKDMAI